MPDAMTLAGLRAETANVLRFGFAGLANTLFGGGIILLLEGGLGANPFVANAFGIGGGLVLGFGLNRYFVFQAGRAHASVWRYGVTIALAFAGSQSVLAASHALGLLAGGKAVAAQVAAMTTYTAINFVLCRFWVFRER